MTPPLDFVPSMELFAVFGITGEGLNLVVNLLLLFLVVFWLALVYWTFSDARRRIADPMVVGCATAASLFPFAGTVVYMIVRPPEYLEDVRERELEIAAAEVRLAAIEHVSCSYCNFEIERSFLRCPNCLRRLKEPCTTCGKPLAPGWKICPYCESEIGQAPPQPRRRARPAGATPAPGGQRRPTASEGQRRPAAAEGQRRPAASERPRPAASGQRPAAPDGKRQPGPGTGEGERPASAGQRRPRSGPPATDGQSKRPPAEAEAERPEENHRKKRPGTPAAKRQASPPSDAVTAEQPVARPRTRPPSAG